MKNIDQVTVKALELTAPWASTADARILRGKVLGGEVFCSFSQQEREEIWIQLQTFKDLVPSLYSFFEDIKLLEAWSNCLRWMICLSPRDTVFTALEDVYTGVNQDTGSALVQETETLFKTVPASFAYQRNLARRQLWAFAMRYHREIPRRSSGKDLLAKPTVILNTAKLREMADLADRLGFESPEIRALQQYPRSQETAVATGNNRPVLVTDGPGETRRERCGMPYIQSYEEDRKFLFITHLHDDRNEQSEGITSFFRLRSVYLKFYGMPRDAVNTTIDSSSQHLSTLLNESQFLNSHSAQPISSLTRDQIREHEHMNIDEEQLEVEQTALRTENAFVQETLTEEQQRQEFPSDVDMSMELEQETQMRQQTGQEANALGTANQEQVQTRQQLEQDADRLRELEQEQERQRQALELDQSALETAKQEQVQTRQQLERDANTLRELEQEQAQSRQKLEEDASALRELEQEQERSHQKLAINAKEVTNRQEKQSKQLLALARQARELVIQEQNQNQQQQDLARKIKRQRRLKKDQLKQERENSNAEQRALHLEQNEPGTSLEQEERNMEDLQRQGQDELADLETPSPLELGTQASYAHQIIDEAPADNFHEVYEDEVFEDQAAGDQPQGEIPPLKPSPEDGPTPEEHPTGEHSTSTGKHPTPEEGPTPEDNLPQTQDQSKERHAKRGPELEEIDDSEALRAQQIQEGRKPLRNKFQRLSGYPLYRINYEGNTFMDGTE